MHVPVMMVGTGQRVRVTTVHGDHVELAVGDAALGQNLVGESANSRSRSLEKDIFEAMLVIQMDVRSRHDQIVMRMLSGGEPLGQIPDMVVKDVAKARDALSSRMVFDAMRLDLPSE